MILKGQGHVTANKPVQTGWPGKKLADVGDVGAKNLRRFSSPTVLPGPKCSTKKVGDTISPTFLNSDFLTRSYVLY